MPRHPTRLRPPVAPRRSRASRLLACIGVAGALCAGAADVHAQGDAKAALIEQGQYWQSMGRNDLAAESWRKLLSIDPQSADAMYGMSQVELARGNASAARGWTERLHAAHPNDPHGNLPAQQAGATQTDLQRARAAARAGRTAEAAQIYRSMFGDKPPPEPLAVEYYQALGGTQQGWEEGLRGLQQLVRSKPDNSSYKLALAQLQTYREPTRREGIRSLAELAQQPGATGTAARASWRQALIWLDAREADTALYRDFLALQPDPAVQARLDGLNTPRTAEAAAPGAQALGEGFKALDRGDQAGAEQRFQQALRAQPGDTEALGGLGLIRLRQQRFAEAQELLEKASRGSGGRKWASALQSATYWNLIGQANAARSKGDLQAAQNLLERAVKLDPNEKTGRSALAELRQSSGIETTRAKARSQAEAGDTAGAQRTLEDAMLAAPDNPWLRLDLANIYRRQGLTAEARGVMDGLLMSQPDMPDALYASALLASDAGEPATGLQYLDRIPPAARSRDMTQLQRRLWTATQAQQAQALAAQGQQGAARALLAQTEAALGNDMSPESRGQLAGAYADIGDTPRALAMIRQLLARSPNPGVGDRLLYASVLLKTQQDVELSAVLRQLQGAQMTIAQREDYDRLRIAYSLRQADALRQAGNLEAAYSAIAPVLAERPEDPQALAALARLYSAAHDERQALAIYQRVLQRNPGDLDALLAAAASASSLQAHAEAKGYVQAALKIAPDQSRVLAAAGRIYRDSGDSRQAEQYLRAAIAAESAAAGGRAVAANPVTGLPLAAANPFAGMTGGVPGVAAVPPQFASAAAYPTSYPATAYAGAAGAYPASLPASYPQTAPMPAMPAMPALPPLPPLPQAAPLPYPAQAAPVYAAAPPAAQPWSGSGSAQGSNASQRRGASSAQAGKLPAPQAQAYVAQASAPAQYVQGLPAPAAAYAPGYPPPGAAYARNYPPPPVPGSNLPGSGSYAQAPTNPLVAELQDIEAQRATTVDVGSVFRNRDGEAGLSKLWDMEVPIETRIPAGNGKIVVTATPTVLDNGTMAQNYGTTSRFGGGPQAAIDQLAGRVPAPESQNASGLGLSVGYEGKNWNGSIGSTPLGFQQVNVVGNLGYSGQLTDTLSLKGELSRRAVTDSLLSFAGTEDTRSGLKWGGVVATGGRLDMTRDDGQLGLYGYGSAYSITGHNVEDNSRYELGGGVYVHLLKSSSSSLTAGMNVDLLGYDKDLSYFTYGQGGYFSPQSYASVAFPVDWSGRDDRLSWRLNASLGVQSFNQDGSPYFPTDPARQAAAASAVAQATNLNLNQAIFTGFYPSSSHTGLAYNFAGFLEYQVAPQLYLGGAMVFNNAQNYRQISVSAYLRYMLGNTGRFGSGGGASLRPVSSPYTPLL